MAEGNKVGCFFGTHNPGDPSDTQYIAFLMVAGLNTLQRLRMHVDIALRDCDPTGDFLAADIHHMGLAGLVEMSQI